METAVPAPASAVANGRAPLPHPLIVRVTHWTNTVAFAALAASGVAILLAHPRLYWGETGALGSPALIELPLTMDLDQSGWGRSLHFLAAWVCVLNGALYVGWGLATRHFRSQMTASPAADADDVDVYGRLQARTYLGVVFVLLPLLILTGLSMSPAVMAAVPVVTLFGGHQSARTLHFFAAAALCVFFLGHVAMVSRSGAMRRMRRMIAG